MKDRKVSQYIAFWSLTAGVPAIIILTILIQIKELING